MKHEVVRPPLEPMEAATTDTIPVGWEWQYEPKWDGFRCLVFRDGDDVFLQSKSKPLARYFPEVVANIRKMKTTQFVLDGELVIAIDGSLSFDALLQRLHPAESRVRKLSVETPATFIVFDLLQDEQQPTLLDEPLVVRRDLLETFAERQGNVHGLRLSPATQDVSAAEQWFGTTGGGLDGIIAKNLMLPYASGERTGMMKYKHLRTADCVVGGFRYGSGTGAASRIVGSLLLGLYDDEGKLNHVGFTSAMSVETRTALTPKLEGLKGGTGFTGKAPGGPSRWNQGRESEWVPLKPQLVVEVQYDHFTGDRFRHGTGFQRWRPDRKPQSCTIDQLQLAKGSALSLIE
ncbi:MAG: ATP-dependent DNA ligase [Phycisphaerae bacterium]|nr:ATP-dependent DNA ligase [Gemmatimonadaceae bacterium]